jgi:hypothetical protein
MKGFSAKVSTNLVDDPPRHHCERFFQGLQWTTRQLPRFHSIPSPVPE